MSAAVADAALLRTYPRARPPLSPAHEAIFETQYKENRSGEGAAASLAQRMEAWMHRRVAAVQGGPVLELGAGTLNHAPYEAPDLDYDAVEPFTALYEDSPARGRIRDIYTAQADIPEDRRYRRIFSVAVLEHMLDLPGELALSALKLTDDGVFQAGVPSEGGFLWWLGWRGTTGLAFYLKHRLDYGVCMRHEHVSKTPEIIAVTRRFFEDVSVTRWPTPLHHLSFYAYIEARGPRRDFAQDYLSTRAPGASAKAGAGAQQESDATS